MAIASSEPFCTRSLHYDVSHDRPISASLNTLLSKYVHLQCSSDVLILNIVMPYPSSGSISSCISTIHLRRFHFFGYGFVHTMCWLRLRILVWSAFYPGPPGDLIATEVFTINCNISPFYNWCFILIPSNRSAYLYRAYACQFCNCSAAEAPSSSLRQAAIPVIKSSICQRRDWLGDLVKDNMMCAGYADGGVDTCYVSEAVVLC